MTTNQPVLTAVTVQAVLGQLARSGVQFIPRPAPQSVQKFVGEAASKVAAEPPPSKSPADADPLRASIAKSLAKTAAASQVAGSATVRSRLAPVQGHAASDLASPKAYNQPALPILQRQSSLATIADQVANCQNCELLASQRTMTVPGEGNAAARVCFLGEAPGAEEDASGRPFVGRAGQLLTRMIEACTFSRDDVFILNTIKCRPPGNRNPEFHELSNCRGFLDRQLEIIQPEYIVCLGLVAAQAILNSKLSVGRLRGQFHSYRASKVLVTYHPSYLLREQSVKKAAWDDLQLLLKDMRIVIPKRDA